MSSNKHSFYNSKQPKNGPRVYEASFESKENNRSGFDNNYLYPNKYNENVSPMSGKHKGFDPYNGHESSGLDSIENLVQSRMDRKQQSFDSN